jgi:hypothetical protein
VDLLACTLQHHVVVARMRRGGACFSAQCLWYSSSEILGFRFAKTVMRIRVSVDMVMSALRSSVSVYCTAWAVMLLSLALALHYDIMTSDCLEYMLRTRDG